MRRRALLRGAALFAAGTAGCVGDAPAGSPTATDEPTDSPPPTDPPTPTPSPSPSPSPTPGVRDRSFEVRDVACGTGTDRATVEIDGDTVRVEGTIEGRDTCHSAELAGVAYDPGADRLTVRVRSYVPAENRGTACGECIVDIEYRATVTVAGDAPGTVEVRHDGAVVDGAETTTSSEY